MFVRCAYFCSHSGIPVCLQGRCWNDDFSRSLSSLFNHPEIGLMSGVRTEIYRQQNGVSLGSVFPG